LHTGGASLSSHVFFLFGSVFAPVVLRFKFHIIKKRELFSLSSPSSFPTRSAQNYTHATRSALTRCTHCWRVIKKIWANFEKGKKTSGTQGGYHYESSSVLTVSIMISVGVFCARRHLPTSRMARAATSLQWRPGYLDRE
jgi:hypothetical protein